MSERLIRAVHGIRQVEPDPEFEVELAAGWEETTRRPASRTLKLAATNSAKTLDRQ